MKIIKIVNRFIVILLIVFSVQSCNRDNILLVPVKQYNYKIINNNTFQPHYCQYVEIDNSEYLVFLNSKSNGLDIYNLNDSNCIETIDLSNISSGFLGFYIHNFDSIFFLPRNKDEIYLVNNLTEIKNTYKWELGNFDMFTKKITSFPFNYQLAASMFNPIKYIDNKIYVCNWSYLTPEVVPNSNSNFNHLKNVSTQFIFNIKGCNLAYINNNTGIWPNIYTKNTCYLPMNIYSSKTINDSGHIIYSFAADPKLYIYSEDTLLYSIKIKSKHQFDIETMELNDIGNKKKWSRLEVEQPMFIGIYYDKYRKVYYRIYKHSLDFTNDNGTINKINDCNWSIIILDENFNTIGEQLMPAKKYLYNNIIVIKEGLLIDNNHELNKHLNKNYYSYTLFKFK